MNLWLRILWIIVAGRFKPALVLPDSISALSFRVWFHDLDAVGHMNNGRYLTIMDLGRADLMVRSGLYRAALRHKWSPIASAILTRFRREMRLFQKFRLETRLLYWDETRVVMEQTYIFDGGHHHGHVAARALFKGGLYDRAARQFVPITRLMDEIGVAATVSPSASPEVAAFLAADDEMKQAGRS